MREAFTIWLAILVLLWALLTASDALCWSCRGPCVDDLDCMSGCSCMFPENDDNHHYGRCA